MNNILGIFASIIFAALVAGAASASDIRFSAFHSLDLDVNPVSATEFEVIESNGAGATDIWCAGAQYAEETLGLTRGRIYIAVPRGPARTVSGRKGVTFTSQAPQNPKRSYSVTIRQADTGLLINHALQFCRRNIIELEDRL